MTALSGVAPSGVPAPRLADLQHSLETHVLSKLEYLNAIGIALSQERDINRLLETILVAAKNLTRADGGTLYRLIDDKLHLEIMRNDSLSISMGGTSGNAIPFYPIPLHDKDGVGGTAATLACGGTLTVPAGGSATCGYTATLGSATNGTNTATVTFNSIVFTATKDYTFVKNVVGHKTINVTDTNGQSWGPVSSTSSFPYTKDFTCPSDPSLYTNGVYTMATHENTATIIETGDYDIATVDVTCNLPALQVTKTAAGEWDRTVTWTLEKSVNPASHSGFAGDSFDSTWEVVLTKYDTGPMNYYISGEISIYNPASITQSFTVADTLGDGTPVTIVCPSNTVAAGTTVTCTYEPSPVL